MLLTKQDVFFTRGKLKANFKWLDVAKIEGGVTKTGVRRS
jgi:hypothetical protein